MVKRGDLEGMFFKVSEDSNGFNSLGSTNVPNTTNSGLIATLSGYVDGDTLPNGVSTMLSKEFEVSVRTVRRRFADCKIECAI